MTTTADTLQLTRPPVAQAEMLIRRPVTDQGPTSREGRREGDEDGLENAGDCRGFSDDLVNDRNGAEHTRQCPGRPPLPRQQCVESPCSRNQRLFSANAGLIRQSPMG